MNNDLSTKEQNYKVHNAVIMAAGLSSRFAPLSYEYPKALMNVKGEVLIERQIKQLKNAGINDIIIVAGYKKELFEYLSDKFQVKVVHNKEYNIRNNNSTLYCIKDFLSNTYICSADNYFTQNVFEQYVDKSYYAAIYQEGKTSEWCISTDDTGLITDVKVGGADSWVMLGHVFFSNEFSKKFVSILEKIYDEPETAPLLWESIYIDHIKELSLYIRKYPKECIFEFDTLDELREFDESYYDNTRSQIIRDLCKVLNCRERDITAANPLVEKGEVIGFCFNFHNKQYKFYYSKNELIGE